MSILDKVKGLFNHTIVRTLLLAIIVSSIMIFIPQFIGFGKGGFANQELMQSFQFYTNTGWGFLLILFLTFLTLLIFSRIKKEYSKYKYSLAFASQGELPSVAPGLKKVGNFQIFLISFIVFSILGLANFLTRQTVFTGVGRLAQQFTTTDNMIFSEALVPVAENIGAALVIALALLGLIMLAAKHKWEDNTFRLIAAVFIPILVGVYGLSNHMLRYAGSDVDLIVVFVFWWLGGLLTVLVGSFIPFWVMHINNNLFLDLKQYFSQEAVLVWVITAILVLILIYFILYVIRRKKNSKIP